MDLIDKKILCELDINCRIPIAQLAKKLRIGRNVAAYRIKNLEKAGIISNYICSVNFSLLGYKTYKIYFKISHSKLQVEKQFVDYLIKHKNVIHLLKVEGTFDYSIAVAAKTINELDEILTDLKNNFKDFIKDFMTSIIVYSKIFKLHKLLLDQKEKLVKFERYSSEEKQIKIDETDKKIIKQLSQNANLSIVDLSTKTNLSIDIAKYRLKKLSKTLITSHRMIPNLNKLGYYHYVIMFKLKRANQKDEKEILDWCSLKKNVLYCTKRIGVFDFEINAAITDIEDLNKLLADFKTQFHEIMDSYEILINSKKLKLNYCPL